jgi:hypothetical protein
MMGPLHGAYISAGGLMRYRTWLGLLVVAPLLALFACTPESRNSLPDESRVVGDSRLLGLWRAEPDSDDLRVQVSQRGPQEFFAVTTETAKTEQGSSIHRDEYRLRFFDVGGRSILAVQELSQAPGREPSWLLATYRFDEGNSVTLFFMDEERIRLLVQGGHLPGTIRGADTQFPELLVTAPPAALAELIGSNDPARLFTARVGPFIRVVQ